MTVDLLDDGGAPLLGEPLAVEFANTAYASRGAALDGLRTVGHLAHWLAGQSHRLTVAATPAALRSLTPDDLAAARALRDAVHTALDAAARGAAPDARTRRELNDRCAAGPRYEVLGDDTPPAVAVRTSAPLPVAGLADIARSAVHLLGGPDREQIRACRAPGCVLHFVKDHPRREWCSAGCGNRARAARHYRRHRADPRTGPPAR